MTRKEVTRDLVKIVIFTPLDSPSPVTRCDSYAGGERFITWNGAYEKTVDDAVKFRDALTAAIEEALKQ